MVWRSFVDEAEGAFASGGRGVDAGGMRISEFVRRLRAAALLAAVVFGAACSKKDMPRAQVPAQSGQQDTARPTSTPYAGDLSIFEYPGRDKKLQIDRVMKILGIGPGKSVADLGAGSGWFTVRAARKVGASGVVYAEEINPEAVKYIDDRAAKEKLANVKTVLGKPDDPKLAAGSVDAVLMLKMYHEIARPVAFVKALRPALKAGAKVGIIDRNGSGSGTDHGVPMATVVQEMGAAGFKLVGTYDFTKADGEDYFLVFRGDRD
jgi:SAM-dependent methyltransferase